MAVQAEDIKDLLGLNDDQAKVLGLGETTVVRAGAGAGKTTTLVAALLHDLLVTGVPAEDIAVATFTRSAAAGLKARSEEALYRLLGPGSPGVGDLWLGTIDALALRYLDTFALRSGLPPGIAPGRARDLKALSRQALETSLENASERGDTLLRALAGEENLLSALENLARQMESKGRERFFVHASPRENKEEVLQVLEELALSGVGETSYEKIYQDMAAISADRSEMVSQGKWNIRKESELFRRAFQLRDAWRQGEIENNILPLLEGAEELFYSWQEEYRRLRGAYGTFSYSDIIDMAGEIASPLWARTYIDEAQDTSLKQRHLMESLTYGPTVFVGDKNQSIYNFRGANARLWQRESEGLPTLTLRDNYRSGQEILSAVETFCRPLLGDDLLQMKGHKDGGTVSLLLNQIPKGVEGSLAEIEARTLLPHVFEKIESEGYSLSQVAILLPTNKDISDYTRILRKMQIPCLALRAKGLLGEEECQDMKAALALLADQGDGGALVRLLSSPFFGWGKAELMAFADRGEEESIFSLLPADIREKISSWRALLGTRPPSEILRQMTSDTSFLLALNLLDPTGLKVENVEGFFGILEDIEAEEGWSPTALLESLEREIEADDEGQENRLPEGMEAVRLLTIHRAKGDEFPVVIFGRTSRQGVRVRDKFLLDDDDLGFSLSKDAKNGSYQKAHEEEKALLEEEGQRLFYVALTRAEERLFLLASSFRKGSGFGDPLKATGILDSDFPRTEFVASDQEEVEDGEIVLNEAQKISFGEDLFSDELTTETLSWSRLASWDECSLRRDLEIISLPPGHVELSGGGARRLGEKVHGRLARDILSGDLNPEAYPKEARTMIDKLVRSELLEEILAFEKRETEVPFLLPLGDHTLRGRIDLLLTAGEKAWVLDWKSGEDDHFASYYLLQRKIYALALLKTEGIREVRATTHYLRAGRSEEEVYSDTDALASEVLVTIEEILARPAAAAAKKPEPFCQGCPGLLRICPVSQVVSDKEGA